MLLAGARLQCNTSLQSCPIYMNVSNALNEWLQILQPAFDSYVSTCFRWNGNALETLSHKQFNCLPSFFPHVEECGAISYLLRVFLHWNLIFRYAWPFLLPHWFVVSPLFKSNEVMDYDGMNDYIARSPPALTTARGYSKRSISCNRIFKTLLRCSKKYRTWHYLFCTLQKSCFINRASIHQL